ncbi:MAG: radical SAM protein [Candidatus Aminicenantes bacterium]|nr:radical SAM protein [Candidatus Aminicenantes bacterium]
MSATCEGAIGPDGERFWEEFSRRISAERVPFSGSLALTHRCNLGCLHCYSRAGDGPGAAELGMERWLEIIDEIKEAGCLYLLLTGGEPLLREDFASIYSHAKRNGFLVTVFTNATLLDDRLAGLFAELPPRLVEVSLYGAGAETHDRVTGVPGSFFRAWRGIERLVARGIPLGLKSVMMTLNIGEIAAIEERARAIGARFRLDPAVFPTLAGDRSPLALRVPPEQAVAREFSDPRRVDEMREFYSRFRGVRGPDSVYACAAGMSTFHVDPFGKLYPCVMATRHGCELAGAGFLRRWREEMPRVREAVLDAGSPCRTCEWKSVCGYCPGFFGLENGDERVPSAYVCELGRLRYERLTAPADGG